MERGHHRHGRTDPAQGKTQPTSADAMCTPCLEAVGAHYHELQWGLSANAARHLRAQRAARQTLIVNPIDPTSGIRQVLARTCTTSTSPSYGLWTVSCTETVGGQHIFNIIQDCIQVYRLQVHLRHQGRLTGYSGRHGEGRHGPPKALFWIVTVLAIQAVGLSVPGSPLL